MSWFRAPAPLLPDLIARHGKWRGARTALIAAQRRLTWAELERDTAQIANGLIAAGLAPGDRIAVLMDNSLELALLLFGILRSGCVAVPLNVSISDAAVTGMIEDAAARAVFASGEHCGRIDALAGASSRVRAALRFAHDGPGPPWQRVRAVEHRAAGDAAAGGDPRGRCLQHHLQLRHHRSRLRASSTATAAACNWAVELALVLRYRSDCVTLCSLGLFSNISWVAMLATVVVGGTIVIMPRFEAAAAAALIESEGITHGTFVPLQLERLLAARALRRSPARQPRHPHVLRLAAAAHAEARIPAAHRR